MTADNFLFAAAKVRRSDDDERGARDWSAHLAAALHAVRRALDDSGTVLVVSTPPVGAIAAAAELVHAPSATKALVYVTATEVCVQRLALPGMPPPRLHVDTGWFRLPLPRLQVFRSAKERR